MTSTTLCKKTVSQLKAICRELGIASGSVNGKRLNKAGLVAHILGNSQKETDMTKTETKQVKQLQARIAQLEAELSAARKQATPPNWRPTALALVQAFQKQNPYGFCPLPALYQWLTKTHGYSLTIGQFHDGLRAMVQDQQLRLHPFTGSFSGLVNERYALLAGQEIKMYAEPLV